ADAVLGAPPGYFAAALTPAALVDYFRAVGDACPVPVLVYNIPKYTHLAIAPAVLEQLAAHPNILGVKDSSGDVKNLGAYRAAVPEWLVFVGSGSLLYAALELGCDGGILALACFAARRCVDLFAAFRAGDRARAEALQQPLIPLNKAIVSELGAAGVKAAMDGGGLTGGPVRAPLPALAPAAGARREPHRGPSWRARAGLAGRPLRCQGPTALDAVAAGGGGAVRRGTRRRARHRGIAGGIVLAAVLGGARCAGSDRRVAP